MGAAIQAAALTEVARRRTIPGPPLPAARMSSPSRPDYVETENTITTKVTALMAEQERASRPPAKATPTTRAMPPPPIPPSRTPAATQPAEEETRKLAATQVLGPAWSLTTTPPDSDAAVPRPVLFEDVLRTERADRPAEPPAGGTTQRMARMEAPQTALPHPSAPPAPTPEAELQTEATLPMSAIVMPSPAAVARTAVLASPPAAAGVPAAPPARTPAAAQPAPIPPTRTPTPTAPAAMATPVLVDVTPRALVVETVGGWCDVVVQRNAKIPCERTRAFATSSDMQTMVRVRVAQGEDTSFAGNTYLGEVELAGLRPAPRGQVTIHVRFEIDESGTLHVSAIDMTTGRAAQATLQLVGIAGAGNIAEMAARHAATRVH